MTLDPAAVMIVGSAMILTACGTGIVSNILLFLSCSMTINLTNSVLSDSPDRL